MCGKAILENGGTLLSLFLTAPKINNGVIKLLMNCPHPLTFVPDCYITQKMCDKTVNTHFFTIQFVPECYQTQEMCDRVDTFFDSLLP